MKIWIIAGESSGDLYGSRLCRELKSLNPTLQISGMGGIEMKKEDCQLLVDSTELGVVGLFEVLKQYPTFRRVFKLLVSKAAEEKPDAVVLIDYPGFNLRLAKKIHELKIPIIYYVSPQVWAWGKKRIPIIAKLVTKMLVIFPFEIQTYQGTGLDVEFVGHPLAEILSEIPPPAKRDDNTVLLLPGSRFSEINRLLEPMVKTAVKIKEKYPNLKFVIPTPREKIKNRIAQLLPKYTDKIDYFQIECGNTTEWMSRATAGLAASGTVTVQAAILGLPLVSCYKLYPLTYFLAKKLVNIKYFTMPNVIAEKEIFQEFLQGQVNPEILTPALEAILPGGNRRETTVIGMTEVVKLLGGREGSLKRAAELILANTKKS